MQVPQQMWECSLPPNSAFAENNHPPPTDSMQHGLFSFLTACKPKHPFLQPFPLTRDVHAGPQGDFAASRTARSPRPQPQMHPKCVCGERSRDDDRRGFQGRSQRKRSDVCGICSAAKMPAMICWQLNTSSQDLASQASHSGAVVCPGHFPFGTLPCIIPNKFSALLSVPISAAGPDSGLF